MAWNVFWHVKSFLRIMLPSMNRCFNFISHRFQRKNLMKIQNLNAAWPLCAAILSVSKKFSESYQKTKIYKQILFDALQNSRNLLQHKFDNVHTASRNNQERPNVESIAERLSHDLWWHSHPQKCAFDSFLQARKQEEVCRSQIRRVRRVMKNSY